MLRIRSRPLKTRQLEGVCARSTKSNIICEYFLQTYFFANTSAATLVLRFLTVAEGCTCEFGTASDDSNTICSPWPNQHHGAVVTESIQKAGQFLPQSPQDTKLGDVDRSF
jgi:hypothetical protein